MGRGLPGRNPVRPVSGGLRHHAPRLIQTGGDAVFLIDAETPAQGCNLNHERRLVARKARISSFFRKRRFHSRPAWV
jgi:hypothetical protein